MENTVNCSKVINENISNGNAVSHPPHYTWLKDLCGIEVIDITRHMDFDLGNAIKYILRAGRKPILSDNKSDFHAGMIQDLKKAIWYINDEIELLLNDKRSRTNSLS